MIEWIYWFLIALWAVFYLCIGVSIVFRRHLDQIAPADFRRKET